MKSDIIHLLDSLQNIANTLQQLEVKRSTFDEAVSKEMSCVRENGFHERVEEFERAAVAKQEAAEDFLSCFAKLKSYLQSLADEGAQIFGNHFDITQLSDLTHFVREVEALVPKTHRVLYLDLSAKIVSSVEKFVASWNQAKPNYEINKAVLAKMLEQKQQNYVFWQNIFAEMQSTYGTDAKQQQSQTARSALRVRA